MELRISREAGAADGGLGAPFMDVEACGLGSWMEGLEAAWCVENDAEVACEWWGQCCGMCFRVNLYVCKYEEWGF
jgi:hypothetical protein